MLANPRIDLYFGGRVHSCCRNISVSAPFDRNAVYVVSRGAGFRVEQARVAIEVAAGLASVMVVAQFRCVVFRTRKYGHFSHGLATLLTHA